MAKTKAKPGINLFDTATKKPPTKAAADKKIVIVTDPKILDEMAKRDINDALLKSAGTAFSESDGIIKEYANKAWIKEVSNTGRRPESFIISSEEKTIKHLKLVEVDKNDKIVNIVREAYKETVQNSMLYIVADSYKKIDEDRYDYMKETYGEDIVSDNSVYTMDSKMIQKYGAEISAAIMGAKGIPAEDKGNIIQKIEKYSVAKGTIEKLKDFAKKAKTDVATIFSEIIPTQSLKSRGSK